MTTELAKVTPVQRPALQEVTSTELTHAAKNFRGMKSFFDYLSQMCDAMADRCEKMTQEEE